MEILLIALFLWAYWRAYKRYSNPSNEERKHIDKL